MQKKALLCYLLFTCLCIILAQNDRYKTPRKARRRMYYRGLRRGSLGNRKPNKQPQTKSPSPTTLVPSIPLINIDGDITEVIDSLIGLDGHESSYSVLPGKDGRCFANGMIMYDKAAWSPKPCVTCLCSKGKVLCDEMMCHPLTCHRTETPAGECCPVCADSVLSSISLGDASEFSGDSPEPNDLSLTAMQKVHTPDEKEVLLKKEQQFLEKKKNNVKENRKRKRIKSHGERKKQGLENGQKDEESKRKTEEEKRRAYEEEELRLEKEFNKKEEDSEEKEHERNEDEDEEEEDILRSDVFRMPPRFPIPDRSPEIPSLPTGCFIVDNTASCINAKLTQIPPIMDAHLTSIEFVGNSITSIPNEAFNGIPNLERIDLRKNNITSSGIGPQAFKGKGQLCLQLTDQAKQKQKPDSQRHKVNCNTRSPKELMTKQQGTPPEPRAWHGTEAETNLGETRTSHQKHLQQVTKSLLLFGSPTELLHTSAEGNVANLPTRTSIWKPRKKTTLLQ